MLIQVKFILNNTIVKPFITGTMTFLRELQGRSNDGLKFMVWEVTDRLCICMSRGAPGNVIESSLPGGCFTGRVVHHLQKRNRSASLGSLNYSDSQGTCGDELQC